MMFVDGFLEEKNCKLVLINYIRLCAVIEHGQFSHDSDDWKNHYIIVIFDEFAPYK